MSDINAGKMYASQGPGPVGALLSGEAAQFNPGAQIKQEAYEAERKAQRMATVIRTLAEASAYRKDVALMSELRAWVNAEKDRLTRAIDDLAI